MNKYKKTKLAIYMVILSGIILMSIYLINGGDPSYHLTCENAATIKEYGSCMYLDGLINK